MATIVVGAVVLAVVALAAYNTFKPGKKSCGCGCSGCDQAKKKNCH